MNPPNCDTCIAYSAMTSECRRHAPTPFPTPNGVNQVVVLGIWPNTDNSKWCAEHLPIQEPQ